MKRASRSRRPSVHITLGRASRLYHLITLLAQLPRSREIILNNLGIGLRTFYRELELLKRCGVKVQHKQKLYSLATTAEHAQGRLPFPDPQLSFAEMEELARCPGDAAKRLAALLASVVSPPASSKKRTKNRRSTKMEQDE